MSSVRMYVTTYCPYCDMAKRHLTRMGVAFEVIDVTGDNEKRMWLVQATGGRRTVPQIFVGDVSIGGFTDMEAMDNAGKLRPLLDEHGIAYRS